MTRRRLLIASASATLLAACAGRPKSAAAPWAASAGPAPADIGIYSAGPGSGFLPYATGVAAYLRTQGAASARALESKGSVENMGRMNTEPDKIATVFLGTAHEGVNGTGAWTRGVKHGNVRALFPMYETSFHIVALRRAGLSSLQQLAGRRVGVGPAGGPAENFFKGLAQAVGLNVQPVTGTPADLAAQLQAGSIDALWQGASPPIPAIKQVADTQDAVVFGLTSPELQAMLGRFPFLSPATSPAGTYRGQDRPVQSAAAWNFVVAHKDLPDADAYWITRTVLSAPDPARTLHASAGPTRAANAPSNKVLPFHPGALRFYAQAGISGLA